MTDSPVADRGEQPVSAGESEFDALGIDRALVATLAELGYEEPTPVQRQAIPPLLEGRDVLAEAPTGTGKTAAFALPVIQRIARDDRGDGRVRGLVLVPTRELAMQVAEAIHRYGRSSGIRVLPVYGGQAIGQQLRSLRRGVDLVVATPGRAVDHLTRGSLNLDAVEFVVLDEADEMLDMGFAEDLDAVLTAVPATRQTALFSATISPQIARIAKRHLNEPVRVTVKPETRARGTTTRVRQVAYVVRRADKPTALGRILDLEDPTSALVFARTRGEVDDLAEQLAGHGHDAAALHGGMAQDQRDRVMDRFRDGALDILVATDVAARGLDIEHVSHVVNYDIPSNPDAYVHRIGRTGRAGREGVAITLVEPREQRLLRNIERTTRTRLELAQIPTVADLRERRLELLGASLREQLLEDGIERFRVVVEPLAEEFDIIDVALAAVSLAEQATARDGDWSRSSRPPGSSTTTAVRRVRAGDPAPPGRRPGVRFASDATSRPAVATGSGSGCSSVRAAGRGCARVTSSVRSPTRRASAATPSARSRSPTTTRSSRSRRPTRTGSSRPCHEARSAARRSPSAASGSARQAATPNMVRGRRGRDLMAGGWFVSG